MSLLFLELVKEKGTVIAADFCGESGTGSQAPRMPNGVFDLPELGNMLMNQ